MPGAIRFRAGAFRRLGGPGPGVSHALQLVFSVLALGKIVDLVEVTKRLLVLMQHGHTGLHPYHKTVQAYVAFIELHACRVAGEQVIAALFAFPVADEAHPFMGRSHEFLAPIADQINERAIYLQKLTVQGDQRHSGRGEIEAVAEAFLTRTKQFLLAQTFALKKLMINTVPCTVPSSARTGAAESSTGLCSPERVINPAPTSNQVPRSDHHTVHAPWRRCRRSRSSAPARPRGLYPGRNSA